MQHDDYFRSLDSLARFYNSQITVHVGYLLTSFLVLVALLSFFLEVIRCLVLADWIQVVVVVYCIGAFVLFVLYFLSFFPYPYQMSFKFLLGRVQYYYSLSTIVWDHMGVDTGADEAVKVIKWRDRAMGEKGMGINQAISTLFEARLVVSMSQKNNSGTGLTGEAKNQLAATLKMLRADDSDVCDTSRTYYNHRAPLVWFWNLTDLLVLAYRIAGRNKLLRLE